MRLYENQEKGYQNPLVPGDEGRRIADLAASNQEGAKEREQLEDQFKKPAYRPGSDDIARSEGLGHPITNEKEGGTDSKAVAPENLKNAEAAADDSSGRFGFGFKASTGLYRKEGNEADGEDKSSGLRGKAKNFAKSHKKLLFGGAFAGLGLFAGLCILFFLLGSLLIPNFASHITAYQFSRVSQEFADTNEQIAGENLLVDTASDSGFAKLAAQFSTLKDNLFTSITNWRPNKIFQNLTTNGEIEYIYEPTGASVLGIQREKLVALRIKGGDPIPVNGQSFKDRVTSPIDSVKDTFQLQGDISDELAVAIPGTSTLIRSLVARRVRGSFGGKLFRWRASDDPKDPENPDAYTGDTEQDQVLATEATEEQVTNGGAALGAAAADEGLSNLADGENAAQKGVTDCVSDPTCIKQVVDSGDPVPPSVVTSVAQAVDSSGLETAIGAINPIYKWAVPICIVYDGSLEHSGKTIDNQDAELERAYFTVASAADQQKAGDQVTAGAIGGFADQLGGATLAQSNPEIRAAGGMPNISSTISGQASAVGTVSLLNTFLPTSVASFLNSVGGSLCPDLTNVWVGGGLGVAAVIAKIASDIVSGGAAEPAEDALDAAVTESVSTIIKNDLLKFTGQLFSKETFGDLVTTGGLTAGATFLAKKIVADRASLMTDGLSQGVPLDNQSDEGGNIYTNALGQQMMYGRPMTNTEVALSHIQSQEYLANQAKLQSAYQRYFAISNPDSLLTNFGTTLMAHMNGSVFSSILPDFSKVLSPMSSLANIFNSMNHKLAYAADTNDTSDYGVVQWGWTPEEENLINTNATYEHILVNDQTLEQSGKAQDIANTYSKCFGYNPDGTPNSSYTMGYLLSGGYIVRDNNGNVEDDSGLCSPDNLGPNNPTYGDLVFRWRLSNRNNAVMDHLMSIQNPGS